MSKTSKTFFIFFSMKKFAPWKVILVSNLKLPIYIVRLHVWSTKRRCYCVFAIFKREIGNVSIGCQMLYTIVIIRVVSPSDSREARCSLSPLKFGPNCGVTGKYFSEAFIRDCLLNSPNNTSSEHVVYKNCFFLFWHSKQCLYTTCSELIFRVEFNEQSDSNIFSFSIF